MKIFKIALPIFMLAIFFTACQTVDLFEKTAPLKNHKWEGSYTPQFSFVVKDTTTPHQLFFVMRHNEKYNYNNIIVNIYVTPPGADSAIKIQKDLMLGSNEKGWLATGMDDIYEHRIKLGDPELLKAGEYIFKLEQIMREDPLENVLNVGIRIEKTVQ